MCKLYSFKGWFLCVFPWAWSRRRSWQAGPVLLSGVGRSGRGVSSCPAGRGPDQRRRSWAAWAWSRRRSAAAALRGPVPWSLGRGRRRSGRRQAAGARAAPGPDFPGRRGALYSPLKFSRIYSPAHFSGNSRHIRFSGRRYFCFFKIFPGAIYSPANTPICSFPIIFLSFLRKLNK